MCYSDDTYVLTDSGWKLFKDVDDGDKIMSLNPDTFHVEWVDFTDRQVYGYDGKMIKFHNRSLDCLVTPDHNMIYIGKSTNKIQSCSAFEYRMGKGAFYRGCIYSSNDIQSINIGSTSIDFDSFCEFMGYWLSDGSTIRKSQIVISQQDGESAKEHIVGCIHKMGFTPHVSFDKISLYNRDLCQYLKNFGKCIDKYVPKCIKNASKRQIKIFLDAFIKCDGYIKKPKAFIGNRGGYCKGSEERMYFTTSHQMASDIGELILKYGKRPSYRKISNKGREIRFKNGIYKQNYDSYIISECSSLTSTVFSKSVVEYKGFVYDLTLKKNHIMLVMRNGKCFWGSNCRCYKVPILKTEEEFWAWDGRSDLSSESKNSVNNYPDAYIGWINKNAERIIKANKKNTLPYFIKDNNKDLIVEYAKYLTDKNYKNVRINLINGGLKATHIEHSFDKKTGEYEKAVQNVGFKNGYRVILEAENHSLMNVRNIDGLWNGKKFEIATASTATPNNIRNALKHCASKPDANIAVLYFPSGYSDGLFEDGLSKYNGLKGTSQYRDFMKIICIYKGDIVYNK